MRDKLLKSFATKLHDMHCHWNHIDGCDWHYIPSNDWNYPTKKMWLTKAEEMIQMVKESGLLYL